ncbi:MAG: hypothetical protein WBM13_10625 [Bacteroidia bacterium]
MINLSIITTATYNNMSQKGAFGCVVLSTEEKFPGKGFTECFKNTTAPRLELLAIIRILQQIEVIFPEEVVHIELTSKMNYITQPFEKGTLAENLKRGEGFVNYDLWKQIYDLGNKHIWEIVKLKTPLMERFHAMAIKKSREAASSHDSECGEDEGIHFSSRKRIPKSKPIFETDDTIKSTLSSIDNLVKQNDNIKTSADMPIIESYDPPI